ncbi:UV-stimulated scaffold protein A [Araneus ventricosus]|uniref:UV-stimulated scaffold protein A n=1 Tax=Araneus ventricosus TaxID=182803 RepID=A0A4Y2MWW2_ARAVE|nr:UV-stimulated scaffold protein A [Araneus ventricosus]GBN30840.1 UV-stimulated scaffold protein A [Araneus ventricosus]
MAADKESEIPRIIEKLTITGKKTLDEDLMKKLKSICKASDQNVNYCYYALMTQLKKEHSEVRYSVLLIINELFCKSSVFRKLLVVDLEEFLELVVETNPDNPLPLPQPRAKEMKIKGLELMQMWSNKFGKKYIRLQLALKFLQNCKKVDFNDMEARNVAKRERQRQEQERLERLLNERISKIQSEMIEISDEISNILMQMENCFRLLVPHPTEDLFSSNDFESCEYQKSMDESDTEPDISVQDDDPSTSNSLRQHGIYDMKNTITIEVKDRSAVAVKANEDTLPVIDNLNDLHKQMSSRHYPLVTNWLKTLTKGSNCTDTLKKAIDLKNLMESALQKYRELNIKPDSSKCEDDDEEDDDFVEVKDKDGYETETIKAPPVKNISEPSCSRELSSLEKAYMWKFKHSENDVDDPTSAASTLSKRMAYRKMEITMSSETTDYLSEIKDEKPSHKSKLLEKAPVLPYDIDLYHWEEEKPIVPERIKFDSLHKFWETKDEDNDENEALKEVQIASLRTRKIDFSGKFEPVKWSCRAPLPSGKLCPRRDRYKCPFHGKIIKRDAAGNPVDAGDGAGPSTSSSSVPDWQDPALLRDIEAATGVDLKIPQKRGKGRKSNQEGGLTNINKMKTNARDRLTKKILKRYKHYAKKLDDVERKKFNDKFGDQWNYY